MEFVVCTIVPSILLLEALPLPISLGPETEASSSHAGGPGARTRDFHPLINRSPPNQELPDARTRAEYSQRAGCARVAADPCPLPRTERRAQRARAREHGSTVGHPLDPDVGRSRHRLLAFPSARRAGRRLSGAPVHDPARLRPRRILPPSSRE